jgi:hypothetical protein
LGVAIEGNSMKETNNGYDVLRRDLFSLSYEGLCC